MAIGTTAAILGSAAIGAGTSILGNSSSNKALNQANNATNAAANAATEEQRRQYDLSRGDNAPRVAIGNDALSKLAGMYGVGANAFQPGGQNWDAYLRSNPDVASAVQGGAYAGEGGAAGAAQRHYNEYGRLEGRSTTAATPYDGFLASPDYQFRQDEQARALTARNAALGTQDSGAAQKSALKYSGNLASGEFNNYADRLSALAGIGQTAAAQNQALGTNYANAVGNIGQNQAQNLASSYQQRGANNANTYGNIAGIGVGLLNNFSTPSYGATSSGPGLTNFAGLYR